jgi:hypothetical protein
MGANVSDEWWSDVTEGEARALIHAIGLPIQASVDRVPAQMLAARFIDACTWYGAAAREEAPAPAIVKYLVAMESLLWTGERYGVTKRTASRAAALCFSAVTWNFEEVEAEVTRAYDVRSDLVHGRVSPSDPQVQKSLRVCERVARELLNSWLERFHQGFDRAVELSGLREHLSRFTESAKAAADAAKAKPAAQSQG